MSDVSARQVVRYPMRRASIAVRVLNVIAAACFLLAAALDLAHGHPGRAVVMVVLAAANAGIFAVNFKLGGMMRARAIEQTRPRVDWSRVFAMERDIYGRTFDHDGAPEAAVPRTEQKRCQWGHAMDGAFDSSGRLICVTCQQLRKSAGSRWVGDSLGAEVARQDAAIRSLYAIPTLRIVPQGECAACGSPRIACRCRPLGP